MDGLGPDGLTVLLELPPASNVDAEGVALWAQGLACYDDDRARKALHEACRTAPKQATGPFAQQLENFPETGLQWLTREKVHGPWLALVCSKFLDHPEEVELGPEQSSFLEQSLSEQGGSQPAPRQNWPDLLANPPWTRKQPKPVRVPGLEPPHQEPALAWLPGEQERWGRGAVQSFVRLPQDWEQAREQALENSFFAAAYVCQAPPEKALKFITEWEFDDPWYATQHFRLLAARHGLGALPLLHKIAALSLKDAIELMGPYDDIRLVPLVSQAFGRLKWARKAAAAYLERHPKTAARGLIPPALDKAKKAREWAEGGLLHLCWSGHRDTVLEVAREYGEKALLATESLACRDPVDVFPSKLPKLPDWYDPALLPKPELADGSGCLDDEALTHLGIMLAASKSDSVYAGLETIRAVCCPESLHRFACSLFELWMQMGAPSQENWAFLALGWLGHDEAARRLTPMLKKWPGEGGTLALL